MNDSIYDVAIIGAGCSGASVARRLSAYDLRVALVERETDVGFGVTKANSGIIHAGFHHPVSTLKARLEIRGNLMFEQLHHELGFPFKRIGELVVAFTYEEMKTVEHLYRQGIENGVPRLEICGRDRLLSLEPKLNPDVVGALYAPTGGIVEPYRYTFTLVESAQRNGVEVFTDFQVCGAARDGDGYIVRALDGRELRATRVVNAAGLYADEVSRLFGAEDFTIHVRKGEEYLLERNATGLPNHVLFPVPSRKSKGILVIPTAENTMMLGPTAIETEDKEDRATTAENLDRVFTQAVHMVPGISRREIITSFAGLRPALEGNDFYIDVSKKAPHFIQVAGIQSPGLTSSPAIGDYVKDLLKRDGLALTEKASYDPFLPAVFKAREKTPAELGPLVAEEPLRGHIVCRCESVSEAEIVEAIHKGHRTLDGIKFYTRSGMGRCQGGFCTYKILKILERETGQPIEAITKRGGGSFIVAGKVGDALSEEPLHA